MTRYVNLQPELAGDNRSIGRHQKLMGKLRLNSMTLPSQVSPDLFLNDTLTEADLAGSRLCNAAMITLRHMADEGGIDLTKSGAFNSKFVVWAVRISRWRWKFGAMIFARRFGRRGTCRSLPRCSRRPWQTPV